jgi:hypothetical protein
MRRIIIILIITGLADLLSVSGQVPGSNTSTVLEKLFSRLLTSNEDNDRIRINDSIKFLIDSYAESDTVLRHKFYNIKYLGQITSPDSRLKIITWNLLLNNSKSRYYCYFINRSGKKNLVYRISGTYNEEPVRTDTTYSDGDWYGALYYDLRPVKKTNQVSWILLGIDYGNPAITRKIIEVLSFTPEGRLVLGKKWFVAEKETKYREVLEYSSSAVISLKFLSDRSIVFDHLVPISPSFKGNKEHYGPDFSYDAYNFEKGMWRLKLNIDARNKE